MAAQETRVSSSNAQGRLEKAKQRVAQGREMLQAYVQRYPLPAVAITFGLGVGVGLSLGSLLLPVRPPTRAERLRREVFEALGNILPEHVASKWRA